MAAPEELELKVKVTADPADITLADKVAQAITRLREVIAGSGNATNIFTAERDALRDALNDELRFIKQAVAEKVATEEEGNKERLAILERYEAKFKALNAQFAQPVQGPQVPPGFFRSQAVAAGVATPPVQVTPPQGLKATTQAIIEASLANKEFTLSLENGRALLSTVDNDYVRFQKEILRIKTAYEEATVAANKNTEAVSRTPNPVQTTQPSTAPTAAPQRLGQQLGPVLPPDWLSSAKSATTAINETSQATRAFALTTEMAREIMKESGGDLDIFKQKVLALQKAHEAAAAAARGESIAEADVTGKVQLFGNAADATFQRVPRGARTAANGLSILAISAETGANGVTSAVRAVGNLAFGLSTLSSSANVVAGAAGIGAVVTILATFIELMIRGTEKTREQEAAFKSFVQTEEAFAARARITAEVLDKLRTIKGADVSGVDFVGVTKQVDDLHKALLQAEKDAKSAFSHVSFGDALSADVNDRAGRVIALSQDLKALRERFLEGKISLSQFTAELEKFGQAQPDLLPQIIQTGQLAANYEAARESLRKFQAEARQAAAEKKSVLSFFGDTPDLAREADEANKRLIEVQKGGPLAALALENERQAMVKAQEAWKQYVDTKRGSQFADIAFRDALEANDRARTATQLRLNAELKTRNATQIEVTSALNAAQREAFSKLRTAFNTIQTDQEAQNTPGAIDALRKSNADLTKARAEQLRGEIEAQKIAARTESELTIKRLQENTALEVKGGEIRNQLIANERARLRLQLIKIDEDAARALIEASTRSSIDVAKKQAAAETSLLNISKDEDERALKAKLNSREITQTEFNERTLAREIKFSDDLLKIQSRSLDAQAKALTNQLQNTPGLKPAEKEKIVGQLQDLEQERRKAIADADDRAAKSTGVSLEATGALSKKISDETAQAQIQILRLTGHNAEASAEEIRQRFKDLIAELKAIGGPGSQNAIGIVVQLQGLAAARAEMEGLQDDVTSQLNLMAAKLNQVHVLLGAHAITERDARRQIVEAERAAADAIEQSLPSLEKQARLLGDHKSAQAVLELKTRLVELREDIRRNSDEFFRLKEVIRDSTQNAIEDVLIKAPTIAFGGNNGQQDEVNALKDHVQSARDELQRLLDLPTSSRTDVVNNRITELRREIDETTNSLNNAKNAIDGWKNLFIRAIDSILDAMLKLEAQMIAQIALEKIASLGKIIFGVASAASGAAGGAGPLSTEGGPEFAEGGPVFGPGTGTSDSINAWLSNKEFVEPASSTEFYGFRIFELLRRKLIPRELIHYISGGLHPLQPRTVTAHHPFAAEGGLVSIPQQSHATEAQPSGRTHLLVEAGEDTTVRVMESDRGMKITFKHLESNLDGLRALLGI